MLPDGTGAGRLPFIRCSVSSSVRELGRAAHWEPKKKVRFLLLCSLFLRDRIGEGAF